MKAKELLLYLVCKHNGDWVRVYNAIRSKEKVNPDEVVEFASNFKEKFITVVDESYPEPLRNCCKPPFLLFYKGNINLISSFKKCVTVVGSRDASAYGLSKTSEISTGLAEKGYTIISGMAKGIDSAAIKAAVGLGKAVGVLGTGLGVAYPSENRDLQDEVGQKGLLLAEYPSWVGVSKQNFPNRNRILASLSCLTLVGGSAPSSGTLITAGMAVDMGREVACLPYRADEGSANNLLIQTGAALVQNTKDVLNLIGPIMGG